MAAVLSFLVALRGLLGAGGALGPSGRRVWIVFGPPRGSGLHLRRTDECTKRGPRTPAISPTPDVKSSPSDDEPVLSVHAHTVTRPKHEEQGVEMFDRDVDYPTAVASYDDEGVAAAIEWCREHMGDGDKLTVWTSLKSNLRNSPELERFVQRYSDVEHITGRGGGFIRGTGPVLMAWADMEDIGRLVQHGGQRIRALCVIAWNEDGIRPWVSAVRPTALGDSSAWEDLTPELDPVLIEAMKGLTQMVNHNNTISAGFEKDMVVSTLLALHDDGIQMNGEAIQGWALANGWSGRNPERLAKYVKDINEGKRPRCRRELRADYVDSLRRRVAANE
ncbi:hypothetical protein ACFFWC_22910 [Plantactinospora siamensis]|uniref:Uncharacterized protein n=1 Tax=Plantactinospora siamensis TaxID=555372 RepID=A0ABV6NU70_9ACTN